MNKLSSRATITGFFLSLLGAVALLISGYGYQWGLWGLGFAFQYLLLGGGILGLVGFIVSFMGFLPDGNLPRRAGLVLAGIILGGATLTSFSYWFKEAQKYPPIHDITTDTQNPPKFNAIVPLRADAPNATEYGGSEVAKIQKEHYPDIETLTLDLSYSDAFDKALEAARETSWDIIDYDKVQGRIEATHTLAWYGFKDDVVIRVDSSTADSTASKIDVRSVSRLGRGDLGVNAERIKSYLDRLKE